MRLKTHFLPEPESEPIETSSLHEVKVWVQKHQAKGTLKRCCNLLVSPRQIYQAGSPQTFFYPKCTAHSFDFACTMVNELDESKTLITDLHRNIIRCPQNCTNYKSLWKPRAAKPFKWMWAQRKLVTAFGNWFIKLPALVQILIIIGIILAIAPQWKEPIIQIIKAVQGK